LEIKPEIQLRQTQKLVMTPQLQQAIKMLQLSNIELAERIDQELQENPALEIDETDLKTKRRRP
jgi:RNA polymerase sigma-54 factor